MSYFNSNITGGSGGSGGASGLVTKFEKTITISSSELAEVTIDISRDVSNYKDVTNDRIIVELNDASAIAAGDAKLSHTYNAETGVITITSTNSSIPFASSSAVELSVNVYVAGAVQMPPAPILEKQYLFDSITPDAEFKIDAKTYNITSTDNLAYQFLTTWYGSGGNDKTLYIRKELSNGKVTLGANGMSSPAVHHYKLCSNCELVVEGISSSDKPYYLYYPDMKEDDTLEDFIIQCKEFRNGSGGRDVTMTWSYAIDKSNKRIAVNHDHISGTNALRFDLYRVRK